MRLGAEQRALIVQLYNDMYGPLLAYATSTLENRALAEEAVQETFRIACSKIEAISTSENPKGWLTNTLKNVVRNSIKSRARLNRLVVASLSHEEDYLTIPTEDDYMDIFYSSLIPTEDYQLLKRIALDKYSRLEAAEELGISMEACKKRVQRAKEKLQKILKDKK